MEKRRKDEKLQNCEDNKRRRQEVQLSREEEDKFAELEKRLESKVFRHGS